MNSKQSYAINFLRALAVISVILYHTGADIFSAGYLGVDIFFFISGYLMVKIFKINNFFLRKFLLRRFLRIFPALLVMLIIIFITSLIFLPPWEFNELLESIVANIFLVPNHYFLIKNSDYFASISAEVPLLHTWSLGIEYFFYVAISILFFLRNKKYFTKDKFYFIIFLIFLISLFLSQMGANINRSYPYISFPYISDNFKFNDPLPGNFYLYSTRIWQFLFGSLIYYLQKNNCFKIFKDFYFLISFLGILILFFSFKILQTNNQGPNFITLLPLTGSALILISEHKNNKFIYFIKKNKIITYISAISFSLYLYHQPIFTIFRIRNYEIIEFNDWFILIPVTFLISHLSYKYIEKIFKNEIKIRKVLLSYILISFIFLFFYSIENLRPIDTKYLKYWKDTEYNDPNMKKCRGVLLKNSCKYGNVESNYEAVLWGDSHLNQLVPLFNNLTEKHSFYFTEITRPGCPPSLNLERSDIRSKCSEESNEIINYIIENKNIDLIVIHAWWEHYVDKKNVHSINDKNIFSEIEDTIKKLSDYKIIIIAAIPTKSINPLKNFLRSIFYEEEIYHKFDQDNFFEHFKKTKKSKDFFSYLEKKYQNINILYPEKYLCDKQKCKTIENNQLLYRDTNHLSVYGSTFFKNELDNLFYKIFK
jgi:peptidoglycan/LPS O-acetylase OafA/YrhL